MGDITIIDGIEYEVVFSGRDELIGPRSTITDGSWDRIPRSYTWSGRYKGKFKGKKRKPTQEKTIDYFGESE